LVKRGKGTLLQSCIRRRSSRLQLLLLLSTIFRIVRVLYSPYEGTRTHL
jgi:hypothetical protein